MEEEALLALKETCLAECGPHGERIQAAETPEERAQAIADQAEAHQSHAGALEAAYKAFQSRSGEVSESHPASGETPLEAHLVVQSELTPS